MERAQKFLDEIGVTHLARYADHSGDAFETLRLAGKALGLPTSLLIDARRLRDRRRRRPRELDLAAGAGGGEGAAGGLKSAGV